VPSAAASRVPDPDFLNASSVGVIAAPGGRGYMVVEFQNIVGCDEATLIGFSSEAGEWFEQDVANPLPSWIWSFDDVISHDGKLWWVDLAMGRLRPLRRPAGRGLRAAPESRRTRRGPSRLQLLLPEKARLPPHRAGQRWQVPLSRDELAAPVPGRRRTEVHHAHAR